MTEEQYIKLLLKKHRQIDRGKELPTDEMLFENKMYGFHREMLSQRATMKWNR